MIELSPTIRETAEVVIRLIGGCQYVITYPDDNGPCYRTTLLVIFWCPNCLTLLPLLKRKEINDAQDT